MFPVQDLSYCITLRRSLCEQTAESCVLGVVIFRLLKTLKERPWFWLNIEKVNMFVFP